MANMQEMLASFDWDAVSEARETVHRRGVRIEWLWPDDHDRDGTVTFDGEELNRDRFAHGAGVPSNKMRKPRASHPRHRDLMGRTA